MTENADLVRRQCGDRTEPEVKLERDTAARVGLKVRTAVERERERARERESRRLSDVKRPVDWASGVSPASGAVAQ